MLRPKQRNPRLLALVLAVLMVVCVCTACAVREPLVEPPATVRTGVTIDRNQAVWFRPEDIHDLQAVELVWWSDSVGIPPDDGGIVRMMRSYSPQDDAAAFDWLETHFGTATAPRAYVSGCCHSTLYLQRTDGVLGKVLVSDSANHAAFQSDEVVFTWSDGDGQAFFDLFGLDGDRLPSYPILPEEEAPRAHFLF